MQIIRKHKLGTLVIVGVLSVVLSVILYKPIEDFVAKRAVTKEVSAELSIIIEKYGLEDVEIDIEFPEWSDFAYSIHLNASMPNTKGLANCVSEINGITTTNEKRWWRVIGDVVINGKNYDPSYTNIFDDKDVSFVVAEAPYYGMDAEHIDHTELGKHDDMELCRDYHALDYDHKSITYYWYNNEGVEIFSARTLADKVISIVDRRDGKLRFESPG